MCDTFVALKNATVDGSVIFGKNSDRDPNEAQELILIPHAVHPDGSEVQCTYISIPQVRETNAVLLSKPFWIWGAEMGANEQGVVIGNEAVFTKVPYDKEPGLIGMDFLRLALERASTADEALDVMIELLEKYGQGGNHGYLHSIYYHNSCLIVDPETAWVFETAGKHWAAERVTDVRSISNIITIGNHWDRASDDLVSFAVSKGWCKDEADFDFGQNYSDFLYSTFAAGRHRFCQTRDSLKANIGKIDVPFAMRLLRDHGPEAGEDWQPGKGLTGAEVCMHASFGPIRISQTTGSLISHLTPDGDTHWVTGTAAPCTSVFKPFWFEGGLPDLGPSPDEFYNAQTLWWQHENLHREILRDYAVRINVLKPQQAELEAVFLKGLPDLSSSTPAEKLAYTTDCFAKAAQMEAEALETVKSLPEANFRPPLDQLAWKGFDKDAKRP